MSGEHTHPETDAIAVGLTALTARVATLEQATPSIPAPAGRDPGVVDLDSFPGATDDDKLAAAITHAAAQTYKPTVRLRAGLNRFTRTVTAFTGMKLSGAGGGVSVEQPRGGNPYATLVDWRGADPARPWLMWPAGPTFGTFVGHMAIQGTATSTIIGAAASNSVAWRAVFRDLGMANMAHAIGSPAMRFLMTACTFDGDWNVNNIRGQYGIHIGGSDNALWLGGTCLLDSPTSLSAGVAAHLCLGWMSKTTVGGLYVTAEGKPLGILVQGGSSSNHLVITGARVEGRNSGAPAATSAVRVEGGDVTLRDCWMGYALGPTLDVRGGDVLVDGATFGRASGSTAPDITHTGGTLRVTNARRRPLVKSTGGTFTHDGTIRTS